MSTFSPVFQTAPVDEPPPPGSTPLVDEPPPAGSTPLANEAPPAGSTPLITRGMVGRGGPGKLTVNDRFLAETSIGRVLDAFGQGAANQWGAEPLIDTSPLGVTPEWTKKIQDAGLIRDINDSYANVGKLFNESMMRPAAAAWDLAARALATPVDAAVRGIGAGIGGIAEAGGQIAEELGGTPTMTPATAHERMTRDILALPQALGALGSEFMFAGVKPMPFRAGAAERLAPEMRVAPAAEAVVTAERVAPDVPVGSTIARTTPDGAPIEYTRPITLAPPPEAAAQNAIHAATSAGERPKVADVMAAGVASPSRVEVPVIPAQRFDDMPPATGGTKLNLNYDQPQQIRDFLRQQAIAGGDYTEARRGVVPWAETERLGQALGLKPTDIIKRQVGEIQGASWMDAATNQLVQSTRDVREAWQKAATGTDADKIAALELEAQHSALMASVVGNEAELGRALNILKKFKATTGEARGVAQIIEEQGGIEKLADRARLGAQLDTPQQVSAFLRNANKPTFGQLFQEFWINGLLSGPVTQAKNMASNLTLALWRTTESAVAGGIGVARGMPNDRVFLGESWQRLHAFVSSGPEMIKAAAHAWKEDTLAGGKIEMPRYQAIPSMTVKIAGHDFQIGGKQIRIPGRILAATDAAFKTLAYRQSIHAQAWRRAAKAGFSGDDFVREMSSAAQNPTTAMMDRASKEADLQTLTQQLGRTGSYIQGIANHNLATKIIAPFVKFGINATKFAGERSILSVLHPEIRQILAGKMGAAARDEQIAKIIVGSSVSATGAYFASQGLVTGGGPKDPAQRAMLRMTGWQPYSFKIGDNYYNGNWNDPASTLFFVAADIYEIGHQWTEADLGAMAELVMASVVNNIGSKTYFQGSSNAIDAIQDPGRYGEKFISALAGTMVPTGWAHIARMEDPYLRDARTIIETMKSRVPKTFLNPTFNSTTLYPKRDIWGEPIVRGGALGPDLISPIYMSKVNNDPVNQELIRLHIWPTQPDRQINGVELTEQQYDDYSRLAGRFTKHQLDQLVNIPGWGDAPEHSRAQVIRNAMDQRREVAKKLILYMYPSIVRDATAAKLKDLGAQ